MQSRFHQRTGSLLALLAMLLITFAPVVSQLLAANARGDALLAELCSAQAPASDAPSHHAPDKLSHLDGQACGYCHFFAHAPGLPSFGAAPALLVWTRQSVAPALTRGERPTPPFTVAQPRAPPVLV